MSEASKDSPDESEIERRRDAALMKALLTPPKSQAKLKGKKKPKGKDRERDGN